MHSIETKAIQQTQADTIQMASDTMRKLSFFEMQKTSEWGAKV
jgi:flavin-binding protein dodecin